MQKWSLQVEWLWHTSAVVFGVLGICGSKKQEATASLPRSQV